MDIEKFRNKLFIFEGMDFTGKTTVSKMLVDHLNKNGIPAIHTFQPGDPEYGESAKLFRSFCKDKRHNLHPLTIFFIFFADKVEQAAKIIKPALEKGLTVVSDRWWHSTFAYQFYGNEIIKKYKMTELIGQWMNYTSVLDLDPEAVFYFHKQIKKHNREEDKNDLYDLATNEFKKRVVKGYEKLYSVEENMWKVEPGNSPEDALQNVLRVDF
jgi:dTMP kinase